VISSQFGNDASNLTELIAIVSGRAEDMTPEERDRRTLARRVLKAVSPLIDDASRKEAELNGRPYAQQMRELDEALRSRRGSLAESPEMRVLDSIEAKNGTGIASPEDGDVDMLDAPGTNDEKASHPETEPNSLGSTEKPEVFKQHGLRPEADPVSVDTPPASTNGFKYEQHVNGDTFPVQAPPVEPPTPPMSLAGHAQNPPCEGGIPWYVAPFDPEGLTIFEERWTGPEILRDMSEELSEMDEDELQELNPQAGNSGPEDSEPAADTVARKKMPPKRSGRRSRNSGWSMRSSRVRR
jgi:NuA3 HAT complex component NTO1